MDTSTNSVKKDAEGGRVKDDDIDMAISAGVKPIDDGDPDEGMDAGDWFNMDEVEPVGAVADDESMDDDGELYVVEAILDHRDDFEDKKTRYLVLWKDYDDSEKTWEPEDQFVGSRDILEAYWELIGGKPVVKKKRGRPPGKRGKKKRASNRPNVDAFGEWLPPKPYSKRWDPVVQVVEALDKDEKGVMWAYLLWTARKKDGSPLRNRAPVRTCYCACPQKMLDFFEKHIVIPKCKASEILVPVGPQDPPHMHVIKSVAEVKQEDGHAEVKQEDGHAKVKHEDGHAKVKHEDGHAKVKHEDCLAMVKHEDGLAMVKHEDGLAKDTKASV